MPRKKQPPPRDTDRFAYRGYSVIRGTGGTWYISKDGFHIGSAKSEDAARKGIDELFPEKNARKAVGYRRAGVTVARVNARGRRATRRRNPVPRGKVLGERSFTLSTLRAVKQGGRAERIWYEDARDGKHYYHDFDGAQGAVMYLCESAAVGKCILIVSGDLATPLWEDA